MYNTMKAQIDTGRFRLPDIRYKVKRLYAMGDLSEEQMDELLALAAENANPETERPALLTMIQTLGDKIASLEERLAAMTGDSEKSDNDIGITEYPVWKPWDGLSSDYQYGAVVWHGSKLWQSEYAGQNVWEPGTVDERFWKLYTPET